MLRRAIEDRACGAQVTSTASTCFLVEAAQVGDVERVGEEVPLRVTEVGAVEPDVGLVEDAVEGHPPPPTVLQGSAP